jgi:hypothetical protein
MIIARPTNPLQEPIQSITPGQPIQVSDLRHPPNRPAGGAEEDSRSRHALFCGAPSTGHQETSHLGGHGASRVLDGVHLLSYDARDEALVAAPPPRYESGVRELSTAGAPGVPERYLLHRTWHIVCSIETTAILLAAVTTISLPGTLFPQLLTETCLDAEPTSPARALAPS